MLGAQTLPDGFFGLFLVSLLATVLSTFNSFSFMAAQTLGQDLINRIRPMSTELLQALCLVITLIMASALVIIIPSAVDLWYILAATFLPALLFALVAACAFLPKAFIKYSASCICLILFSSVIYQIL